MLFNFVDNMDTFAAINVSNNAMYLVKNDNRFDIYKGKNKIYSNIYVSTISPFDDLFTSENVYFKSDKKVDIVRSNIFFENVILGTAYFNIDLKVSLREVSALSINDFELFAIYMRNYNGTGPVVPGGDSSIDSDSFGDSENIDKQLSDRGVISFDLNPNLKNLINTIKYKVNTEDLEEHTGDETNPHNTSISNLSDTDISDVSDGQVISYDAAKGKYVNKDLPQVASSGKVKMDENSDAKYLTDHIDGISIMISNNGFICTKKILGQTVSVAEINYLAGVKSNIQEQIDRLTKPMSMYGVFNTKQEMLDCTKERIDGATSIVVQDESNDNKQMTYIYIESNREWKPVVESSIEVRDFITNPINLENEVTGILPKEKIDPNIARKSDLSNLMDKRSFDSDNDGIIDYAKALYGLAASVQELQDAVNKKHNHANYDFLSTLNRDNIGGINLSDFNNSASILVSSIDGKITFTLSKVINDKLSEIDGKALQDDFLSHLNDDQNPHSVELRELNDVDISNLEDGMGLVYDVESNKFIFGEINSDGKVKLNASSTSKYLDEYIDTSSLGIKDNKLIAKSLDGQIITIAELNLLLGAKSNIQEQIDGLSKSMSMYGVFDTKQEMLDCLEEKFDGSTSIVVQDETNNYKQMTYIYIEKSEEWKPVAEATITVRNFNTNPINLQTEVTGTLPKERIEGLDSFVTNEQLEEKQDSISVINININTEDFTKDENSNLYYYDCTHNLNSLYPIIKGYNNNGEIVIAVSNNQLNSCRLWVIESENILLKLIKL